MSQNMSLGKLGEPNLIFVRQFRFILQSEHLSESFNHSVKIDWLNKKITFWTYEVVLEGKIPIHEWVTEMQQGKYPEEILTLRTFDGLGNEIYQRSFHNLKISAGESNFNYEKSDVVLCEVNISFEKVTEETPLKNELDIKEIKKTNDNLTHVHHLNGKGTIP